jgi:hypothetical protein
MSQVNAEPSTCTPSQGTSTVMYVNRKTTWTMTNNTASTTLGPVIWNVDGVSVPTSGNTLPKIYTTIGKKTLSATGTLNYSAGGTTTVSCPGTTTIIKLDTGTNKNI